MNLAKSKLSTASGGKADENWFYCPSVSQRLRLGIALYFDVIYEYFMRFYQKYL
jgi:hypothetical protein